jgi:hypothetical protein
MTRDEWTEGRYLMFVRSGGLWMEIGRFPTRRAARTAARRGRAQEFIVEDLGPDADTEWERRQAGVGCA